MMAGTQTLRGIALALAALAATLLAPVTAGAGPKLRGYTVVQLVDAAASTVTLQGEAYQVVPSTKLEGQSGERIELGDLRPAGRTNGVAENAGTAVFFEATEGPRGLVLDELRVVDALPR